MKILGLVCGLCVVGLSGCASFDPSGAQRAGPGQATYHYKKGPDGSCEVVITSAREVPGLKAKVDKNCAVTVQADALGGMELQMRTIEVLNGALDLLR